MPPVKAWLYAGAALAVAVGLALALASRPRPAGDAGPDARADVAPAPVQALAERPAAQTTASAPAPAVEAAPDYALGKNWRRYASAAAGPSTPIPPNPQIYYFAPDGHPPPLAPDAAGAAIEASALASADGGPPTTLPVVDDEATPEAAGDTRVDR